MNQGRQQWVWGAALILTVFSLVRPGPSNERPPTVTRTASLTTAARHGRAISAQASFTRINVAVQPHRSSGLASLGQFRQDPGLLTPYGLLTVTTGPVPSSTPGGRGRPVPGTPWLLRLVPWSLDKPLPDLTLSRLLSRPILATLPGRYHGAKAAGRYRLQLLGATGPWAIYLLTGTPTRGPGQSVLGSLNLTNGQTRTLATFSGRNIPPVSVGSQRVLVLNGPALDIFHLTTPRLPPATLPAADYQAARLSLEEGFDAPRLAIPGLRTGPPRAAGLVPYQSGTFALPMDAPPGWTVLPPVRRGPSTVVTLVNPLHPHEWISVSWNPSRTVMRYPTLVTAVPSVAPLLPRRQRARVAWLSDVTVAFRLRHAPQGYAVNGMIYPDPAGGSMEIQVSLPAHETPLATAILNSAGIPY